MGHWRGVGGGAGGFARVDRQAKAGCEQAAQCRARYQGEARKEGSAKPQSPLLGKISNSFESNSVLYGPIQSKWNRVTKVNEGRRAQMFSDLQMHSAELRRRLSNQRLLTICSSLHSTWSLRQSVIAYKPSR